MLMTVPLPSFYQPFQPTLTSQGQSHFGIDVQLLKPNEPLEGIVYAFVQVKVDQPTVYPIVPDGTNILFFSKCRESFGGTQAKILEVPLATPKGEYFGIWFYPGAIRHVFNVDLAEAKGCIHDLDYLQSPNSPELRFVHERIYEQDSFQGRALLCEHLLTLSLSKNSHFSKFVAYLSHALNLIYRAEGTLSVDALAAQVGCSARHLNRVFQLHIGASVKTFSQTIRMNCFLKRRSQRSEGVVLPALHHGIDLGFFDQSHLIKSFKKYGVHSLSPTASDFMSGFYNAK